ncbi:hypothetical protein ACPC5U_12930 [Acinetobacter haemolyticus]|uniref:hypothetical protein n=1 Tax=Acinetobacter haemolyticus TaxID=29430 RepID=UPI003C17B7E0
MTITNKIHEARIAYEKKFEKQPELLFVNLQTYEELLKAPQSVLGVPDKIAGAELIPANTMHSEFELFTHEDLGKAIDLQKDSSRHDVSITKWCTTDRKEAANPNARRIAPDRSLIHIWVPYQAIEAYKRHLANKDLKV